MNSSAVRALQLDSRLGVEPDAICQISDLLPILKHKTTLTDTPVFRFSTSIPAEDLISGLRKSELCLAPCSDGDHSVVQDRERPLDYSQRGGFFDLHQDGMAQKHIPDMGILYCDNPGQRLNPTVFCDTTEIIEKLRLNSPHRFDVLRALDFIYLDKSGQETQHPLTDRHALTDQLFINLGSRGYVRQKSVIEAPSIREMSDLLSEVFALAEQATFYRHCWSKGDLVLWDNHRLLPGRGGATIDRDRRLVRFILNRRLGE